MNNILSYSLNSNGKKKYFQSDQFISNYNIPPRGGSNLYISNKENANFWN